MKELHPSCSVVVLNYFGEKVLKNTINSLLNLDYPKEKLEILIVDNNSQDKSREIILNYAEQEKNIKYLFLSKNKGFAGGNNEGIRIAKGDYVVLLNNDCIVEQDWLKELVKTAQKDPKIFAVSSKIKLFPRYYNLKFNYNSSLFLVNVYLHNSDLCKLEKSQKIHLSIKNKDKFDLLEIPYALTDIEIKLEFIFEIGQKELLNPFNDLFRVLNTEGIVGTFKKIKDHHKIRIELKLNVNKFDKKVVFDKVQNAGIVVFQDGSGRDIGAKIVDQKQYYEYDYNQYGDEQEIYAACGAAVLYNKGILDKMGYLDELFFMYYEDVEISERARLRGYKIYYSPNAEVRHLHAFSSKEWSNFFIYQAEKGRLLHTYFAFPLHIFIRQYLIMILKICEVGLRISKGLSDRNRLMKFIKNIIAYARNTVENEGTDKTDFGKIIQYIKIIFYFLLNLPILAFKKYIKHKGMSQEAVNKNYKDILKGRWYFNS